MCRASHKISKVFEEVDKDKSGSASKRELIDAYRKVEAEGKVPKIGDDKLTEYF